MTKIELQNSFLEKFAEKVRDHIFLPIHSLKTKVFLCGANLKKVDSVRSKIDEIFTTFYDYQYEIIYPEDIFEELLSGPGHESILSLENLLVESVDAVVLIPESAGSFAELGAFSNNIKLREKIVCIQDVKRENQKSFINLGPIKLIKQSKKGKIIKIDYSNLLALPQGSFVNVYASEDVRKIRSGISAVKNKGKLSEKGPRVNLLNSDQFVLVCIFLFENADKKTLLRMFQLVSKSDPYASKAGIAAAISVLNRKNLILQTPSGLKLTKKGLNEFKKQGKNKSDSPVYDINLLDDLRLEVLTVINRRKKSILN